MAQCRHCGASNNNGFVCRICGRSLTGRRRQAPIKLEGDTSYFMREIRFALDKVMGNGSQLTAASIPPEIDWSAIVREEGQSVIGNHRYRDASEKTHILFFQRELLFVTLISATTAAATAFVLSSAIFMQVYLFAWLFFSFLTFFLFPLITKSTPIALLADDTWLFGETKKMFLDTTTIAVMWTASLLYIVPPFFWLAEWIGYVAFDKKTKGIIPALARVTYMKRCD